jgi:hypothetical protein
MICAVSYKNIKNKLKGGWKKKFLAGTGSPASLPLSPPLCFITEFELYNVIDLHRIVKHMC